jgi:hypothetical protein
MNKIWQQISSGLLIVSILFSLGWPMAVKAGEYVLLGMEVLVNPIGSDTDKEYIHIINDGDFDVDLSNWYFLNKASETHIFSVTVPAQGDIYLCANTDSGVNGGFSCAADLGGLDLVNSASSVELYTPFDELVMSASWDSLDDESDVPFVSSYEGLTGYYEIELDLLGQDTFNDGDTITFTGTVITPEPENNQVLVKVFNEYNCEGGFVSYLADLTLGDGSYLYEGTFTATLPSAHSILAGLIDVDKENTFIDSTCQNFDIEEVVRDEGFLSIEKVVENYEDDWAFSYVGVAGLETLTRDTSDGRPGPVQGFNVWAGVNTITEPLQENWSLTHVYCEYQTEGAKFEVLTVNSPLLSFNQETQTFVVDVPANESVYCRLTNTYTPPPTGFLTIEKVVENYEDDWAFDFSTKADNFTLSNVAQVDDRAVTSWSSEVLAGQVVINEDRQKNWEMSDVSCRFDNIFAKITVNEETNQEFLLETPNYSFDDDGTLVVNVPEDTSVTCTITNTYRKSSSGTRVDKPKTTLRTVTPSGLTSGTTAVPKCEPLLKNYLRQSWDNDVTEVTKLQNFLNQYGFPVPVSGFFGPLTHAAVSQFQEKYLSDVLTPWGISYSTGFVYKTTKYKINNLVCPGSESMPELY